ncbi:uncharacterized protein SPSK_08181 [Sporothrix schenckii 1099-18]|uniref:Uncharacterized protein n=1 Tax=Sporothrix schenckii 1099-18 TaxID=1397361 RepID=A0A0F2MIZ0_SPOSC|nr:uncharacterized protein SPSK_08181 [Sporothrix schenckii 1099-18]KJR88825.1 hypothetical protein SPSK_08181 [Sporothrix schenckii 1099-18]
MQCIPKTQNAMHVCTHEAALQRRAKRHDNHQQRQQLTYKTVSGAASSCEKLRRDARAMHESSTTMHRTYEKHESEMKIQ